MSLKSLLRKPSAFSPMAMSLAALALVLSHLAINGPVREADEGTAAHLFQLLMILQVPLIWYFAVRWLPQAPRPAVGVLAMQFAAAVAAFVPVWWFQL